jgi:hypothetical protein
MFNEARAFLLDLNTGTILFIQPLLTTIGTSRNSDVILAADGRIGGIHAAIRMLEDRFVIEDFGSGSGTLVNGKSIRGLSSIDCGDEIEVGAYRLLLVLPQATEEAFHKMLECFAQIPNVFSLLPCPGNSILGTVLMHLRRLRGCAFAVPSPQVRSFRTSSPESAKFLRRSAGATARSEDFSRCRMMMASLH